MWMETNIKVIHSVVLSSEKETRIGNRKKNIRKKQHAAVLKGINLYNPVPR